MNIDDKENKLKKHGFFYYDTDNYNAHTYRYKKHKEKFVWEIGETWGEFLDKCLKKLKTES